MPGIEGLAEGEKIVAAVDVGAWTTADPGIVASTGHPRRNVRVVDTASDLNGRRYERWVSAERVQAFGFAVAMARSHRKSCSEPSVLNGTRMRRVL